MPEDRINFSWTYHTLITVRIELKKIRAEKKTPENDKVKCSGESLKLSAARTANDAHAVREDVRVEAGGAWHRKPTTASQTKTTSCATHLLQRARLLKLCGTRLSYMLIVESANVFRFSRLNLR